VSLGRFENCNLLEMDNFRRHGVEDESSFASQLRLAVRLRLPSSAPIGSFHPTRLCPCWAYPAPDPLGPTGPEPVAQRAPAGCGSGDPPHIGRGVHSNLRASVSASTCRRSVKQAFNADVLIKLRPVDSLAGSNETEVLPLGRGSFG
jgi:hypothetical protein